MYKAEFTNARVSDHGFGLVVNGECLESIISKMLGTKLYDSKGEAFGLKEFESNCCNVTVIIEPQPVTVRIFDGQYDYESVEEMEAERFEQFNEKNAKTDPEK